MTENKSENPILNSPYEEPLLHYATIPTGIEKGSLDYMRVIKGRRVFAPDSGVQAMPTRKKSPQTLLYDDLNDFAEDYRLHLVNLCRKQVGLWREANYPNTTRVTKELLYFLVSKRRQTCYQTAVFCSA